MQTAAALLREGRGAEAAATVRAAQALAELMAAHAPEPPPAESTGDELAAGEARARAVHEELQVQITERAHSLAIAMLSDHVTASGLLGAFALRWRAANLGPDVALADYRTACEYSSHPRHWDAEGNLISLDTERDEQWKRDRPHVMGALEQMRHARRED